MRDYEHGGDIYGNPDVRLDFSVNTNPLGMPVAVRTALVARVDEFSRYPDPWCRELCAAIAVFEGVPESWILCGNGAADLIYRVCYAERPRKALICAPGFSEYERALEQVGCGIAYHFLRESGQFELTESLTEQLSPEVDILFLCHPHNPSGRLISMAVLTKVLRQAKRNGTRVIVDECFLDFTGGLSAKAWLPEMSELVVLKALTKTYALAGLRLGYLLTADDGLLRAAEAAAQCWSVSLPAQVAGKAALVGTDWLNKTRRFVAEERDFLGESLSKLGIRVFPSDANFFLLRCEVPLYGALLEKGILVRSCENFKGLDASYYRIGLKTRPANLRLIKALKEILYG